MYKRVSEEKISYSNVSSDGGVETKITTKKTTEYGFTLPPSKPDSTGFFGSLVLPMCFIVLVGTVGWVVFYPPQQPSGVVRITR